MPGERAYAKDIAWWWQRRLLAELGVIDSDRRMCTLTPKWWQPLNVPSDFGTILMNVASGYCDSSLELLLPTPVLGACVRACRLDLCA
eukprot:5038364-Amphidinium_carterae.1